MIDTLVARRDEWGVSNIVVGADTFVDFAPVVAGGPRRPPEARPFNPAVVPSSTCSRAGYSVVARKAAIMEVGVAGTHWSIGDAEWSRRLEAETAVVLGVAEDDAARA